MPPEPNPTDWGIRDRQHGYAAGFRLRAEREFHGGMTGPPVLPDGDFGMSGTGSDCCR